MKTQKETRLFLNEEFGSSDDPTHVTYSSKTKTWTIREGFFYTHGRSSSTFAEKVLRTLPGAVIVDKGTVHRNFQGGASVRASSHWWVEVNLEKWAHIS